MPIDVPETGLLVPGFGVGGFRSIRDLQFVGPMRKITIIAGQNNAGKSNILRFLRHAYSQTLTSLISNQPQRALDWSQGADAPLGSGGESVSFALPRDLTAESVVGWASNLRSQPSVGRARETLGKERGVEFLHALGSATYNTPNVLWRVWHRSQRNERPTDQLSNRLAECLHPRGELKEYLPFLSNSPADLVERELLPPMPTAIPTETVFIPAFRQIRAGSDPDWDGAGLIDLLADLRDPDIGPDRAEKESRWAEFQSFVRTVLESPDADIRVPAVGNRLIVTMDGRTLDVEDLGTGIHEVFILAAAATAYQESLFLIEEPEIHLHPLLQRRLIDYLMDSTSNQYVIATHSAHLLDFERSSVLKVSLSDGWTVVSPVDTNTALVEAARELGYRPSDLLQANAIVWVEGPSDRIYLRYWIETADRTLVEGVDYSIMFYGGRLASHLSGTDSSFGLGEDELIELRRLNRVSAIVIDSDRKTKGEHVRKTTTKGRLRDEFREGGIAWITRGREIENYIDPEAMLTAIQLFDSKASRLVDASDYERRWRYRRQGSNRIHDAPKVKLAHALVSLEPNLDVLDLKQRIGEIVALIKSTRAQA